MALLTVKEAAARLNVTPAAIYLALSEGRLTRHGQGRGLRVDEAELTDYRPRAYRDRLPLRRAVMTRTAVTGKD